MSKTKHEILFSRFGINYTKLPERFRKGSVLVREEVGPPSSYTRGVRLTLSYQVTSSETADGEARLTERVDSLALGERGIATPSAGEPVSCKPAKAKKPKIRTEIKLYHCDLIEDLFWEARPYLLE